jgi:hypothetical protein
LGKVLKRGIPITKWNESTGAIVKVLIDMEVDFDVLATYQDIKDQIMME